MKTRLQSLLWIFPLMFLALTIQVMAQPYPNSGNQSVCLGNIEPYGVINTPGSTYTWSVIPLTGGNGTITGTGSSVSVTWTSVGTCTLQVIETSLAGCVGIPVTIQVTIHPIPDVIATPALQTICSAGTTGITLSGIVPGTVFTWTYAVFPSGSVTGASAGSGSTIAQTLVNTTPDPATVTYTITPTANGCTGSPITIVVTVNPTPVVTALPSSQILCSNGTTGISLSSVTANTTFAWTSAVAPSGSVTGASAGSGNNITQTLINTTPDPATVTYTITPIANGCPGLPITVVVTVNPTPVVTATPASQVICSTETTNITLSSLTASTTYSWTIGIVPAGSITGAAAGSGNLITQTLVNTTQAPAILTYTITPSANSCPGIPITVVVTVNPTPDVIATPALMTICSAGTTGINLSSNTATTTFAWTVTISPSGSITGASAGSGNSIVQTLYNTTPDPATVTYTITPIANGCAGLPISVVITVNPSPNVTATPASQTICSGGTDGIVLSSTTVSTTFTWTIIISPAGSITGASGGAGNSISQTLVNTTTSPATVTYTVTPTANGCMGIPITVVVTVNPLPVPTISGPTTVCVNSTGNVYSTEAGMTNYNWTIIGGTISAGVGTNSITVTWNAVGLQSIAVTYTSTNGCNPLTPIVFQVTVNPLPVPTISGPTPVCVNTMNNVYSTEGGMTNYSWTITGGTITAGAGSSSITVTWNVAGPQTITITYTNINGCNPAIPTSYPVSVISLPATSPIYHN